MKNIKIYAVVLSCLLSTSCVDLNQEPLSNLHSGNLVYNKKTIETLANGLPLELWGGTYQYNCRMMIFNLGADDIIAGTLSKRHAQIDELNVSAVTFENDVRTIYLNMYKLISSANIVITNVSTSTIEKDEVKNPYIGEAYFFRAFAYFNLVRMFGDTPALTDHNMEEDIYGNRGQGNIVRAKTEDIYNQIIVPDLLKAIELMGSHKDGRSRDNNNSKPSKVAAQICLSDVYLTMAGWPLKKTENYANAKNLAATIISENTHHSLIPRYEDLWKEATKSNDIEHIFALNHSTLNRSQYGISYYAEEEGQTWSDYLADAYFYVKYPEGERKDFNYVTTFKHSETGAETHYTKALMKSPAIAKYRDYSIHRNDATTLGITPIYRWADVLLTYAEAQNMADGAPNALAYQCLNEVRQRAAGTGKTYDEAKNMNKSAFEKAIFDERGWEFFAEFKRWYHLVRTEKVKEANLDNPRIAASPSINDGEKLYLMPLPASEIDFSKLPQNNR